MHILYRDTSHKSTSVLMPARCLLLGGPVDLATTSADRHKRLELLPALVDPVIIKACMVLGHHADSKAWSDEFIASSLTRMECSGQVKLLFI